MSDEFLAALEEILRQDDVPQATINKIAIALALDVQNNLNKLELETAVTLHELQTSIQQLTTNIDKLAAVVERHETHLQTHPSLLFLLRYRTKETAAIILALFFLLSLLLVTDLRQPILKFLGLPAF